MVKHPHRSSRFSNPFFPLLCICATIFVGIPALTYFSTPTAGVVAVIFPFNYTQNHSFAALSQTDARIIRQGQTQNIMIIATNDPNFTETIKNKGAWAVVNPLYIGGCSPRNAPTKTQPL